MAGITEIHDKIMEMQVMEVGTNGVMVVMAMEITVTVIRHMEVMVDMAMVDMVMDLKEVAAVVTDIILTKVCKFIFP